MEDVEVVHHAAEVYVGADEEVDVRGGRDGSFQIKLFDVWLLYLPEACEYPFADILTFLQGNSFTHHFFVLVFPYFSTLILKK